MDKVKNDIKLRKQILITQATQFVIPKFEIKDKNGNKSIDDVYRILGKRKRVKLKRTSVVYET